MSRSVSVTYELAFREAALKEWHKLDRFVREQFKAKLAQRLNNPRVPASKLHGHPDRYKIKLRSVGYRLVYEVVEAELVVVVVAVGRRDQNAVYEAASKR
nr:type II toxin-antitoxin system RelE/ParE family toxin [Robbsia andropogonis]